MFRRILCTALLALLTSSVSAAEKPKLLESRIIWNRGDHNAFTDLVRHNDRWYCVFREAKRHTSPEGKIRVITSTDGKQWTSAALLARAKSDLRDPKINVAPDGRLMVLGAANWHEKTAKVYCQPMVWFSKDGRVWSEGTEVAEANIWLWRVTWHKGVARGIGYGFRVGNRQIRLYESRDGVDYKTLVPNLFDKGYPNETSIIYRNDDTALCLLRRDGTPTGLLGTSQPPYTKWTWKDLGVKIGGPHMIELPDGRLIAATRLYNKPKEKFSARTALSWLDPKAGTLKEFLTLPSGGDTSYPGLVLHDGVLWVSYYASHEGKPKIYLARVKL